MRTTYVLTYILTPLQAYEPPLRPQVYFYIALVLSSLTVVGSILSIVFIDEFYDDDECEDDDGTSDDDGFCTKYRLQACQAVACLFCVATIGLTWFFLRSGRYEKFHAAAQASVHPASPDEQQQTEEPDDETPKVPEE